MDTPPITSTTASTLPSTAQVPPSSSSSVNKPPLPPIHITAKNTNSSSTTATSTPYPSSGGLLGSPFVSPTPDTGMNTNDGRIVRANGGGGIAHLETDTLHVMEITLASRPDTSNHFHPPFATFNRTFRHLSRGQVLAIARGGGKFIGNTLLTSNGNHHHHNNHPSYSSSNTSNGSANNGNSKKSGSGVHSYLGFRDLYRAVGPGESSSSNANRNNIIDSTSLLLSENSKFARATLTPRKGCLLVALAGQSGLITADRALIFLEPGDDGRIQEFMSLLNQSVMGGEGPSVVPEPLPSSSSSDHHHHPQHQHHSRSSIFHRPTTPHPTPLTHVASVPAYLNDISSHHISNPITPGHGDGTPSPSPEASSIPTNDNTPGLQSPIVTSPGGSNTASSNSNNTNLSHGLFPTGLSFEYHILASLLRAASANLSSSLQKIETDIRQRVLPQKQRGAPTETHYGLIADAEAKVADFLHNAEAILGVVTDVLEEEEDIESMALSTPVSLTVPVPMALPKLPTPSLKPVNTVANTTTNNLGSGSLLRTVSSSSASPLSLSRTLSVLSPTTKHNNKPVSPLSSLNSKNDPEMKVTKASSTVPTVIETAETSDNTDDTATESTIIHHNYPLSSTHELTDKNRDIMDDDGFSREEQGDEPKHPAHPSLERQRSNVTEEVLRNTSYAAEIAAEAANQAANQAAAAAASTTGALAAAVLMMRALSATQNNLSTNNPNGRGVRLPSFSRMEDFHLPTTVPHHHASHPHPSASSPVPSTNVSVPLSHPPVDDDHHHRTTNGSNVSTTATTYGTLSHSTDPVLLPSSTTTPSTADAQATAMSTMLEVLQGGTGGALTMNVENPAWREEIIAIEELLEWFVAEIEHIVGQGKYLATLLAGERQSMSLVLATNRNRLLLIQIAIQSLTMGMALCSLVSGYFGMNLTNPINDSDITISQYWLLVVFLSFVAGIILVIYFYTIALRIAGTDPTKDKRIFLGQI